MGERAELIRSRSWRRLQNRWSERLPATLAPAFLSPSSGRGAWSWSAFAGIVGLGVLAVTDARSRRLPRPIVQAFAGGVVAAVLIDASRGAGLGSVSRAVAGALICASIVGGCWLLRPGSVAWGDVKVVTIAAAAAAAISWQALTLMWVVTCWTGAALALLMALRRRMHGVAVDGTMTIPLVPALFLGFLTAAWWSR